MAVNDLGVGTGAPVSPPEPTTNGLAVKAKLSPQSGMMKHFGSRQDQAAARFDKMKEAKQQIDAVLDAFGHLTDLQDTVQVRDVVKACAGIVAAGVPAVQMATILADMPEQPGQLQAWVKDEFDKAQQAEKTIDHGLQVTRHGLLTSALEHLIGHSAEQQQQQQLMQAAPAGNA